MAKGIPTAQHVKAEILTKIRDEGMNVSVASAHYQVSSKSIYTWLRDTVVDGSANLIQENEQLYNLLGRATAELKRPKK
ncbi:helix-turn-helix domain-containing protein [Candidatus Saccharibacteria bacterium]|nr:helix-turn-helix domain-containing protein [Candidatus Saccharibacteria bacterium]